MSRSTGLAAIAVLALVLSSSAGGALEIRVSISPTRPAALERTVVVLRAFAPLVREDGSCCRLEPHAGRYPFRVEAVSPTGKRSRIAVRHGRGNEWRGVVRFSKPGRWQVRLPQFFETVQVRVGPPVPTPPPGGFGLLGKAGCAPPSPVGRVAGSRFVVFGTAVGDEVLWALPVLPGEGASWGRKDAAVFDDVVGKEMKIVFAMTSRAPPFHAVGPDGAEHQPVWTRGHVGPTWVGIPGLQWGAGFAFTEAGCWRIRAGPRGDVWILVRS